MPNNFPQRDFFDQIGDIQAILDAVNHIPGSLFMIKDLDSRYVYMSQALREVIHLAPDQGVVGKTDFDLFPKMVAENFRKNDLLVLREGQTLLNEIHATSFFNAPTAWCYSSKFPLRRHDREIVGLMTINRLYDGVIGADSELNRLLPAIEYMTKHYADRITIEALADLCQMSSSHFMRVFKKRMKMTAHQFLEQVRMYHAVDAIRHTSASIASIAHRCGFYDHSSFVKHFKKVTRSTPLRYRNEYQSESKTDPPLAVPELTDDQ